MPRSHPTAVLLALLASLALAAPAAAGQQSPDGDSRPGLAGAEVVEAGQKLGPAPDRNLDVEAIRGIRAAMRSSAKASRSTSAAAAAPSAPAGKALDLKVLLLSADGNEPTYHWWRDAMTKEGVPFDTIVGSTAADLTAAQLRNGVDHGRYQAIVLASGALAYSPDGGFTWTSALSTDEWAVLQAYEKEFAVREVDAYAYPQPAYGLEAGAGGSDMSGTQAQLASGGDAVFTDLVGPVPIDQWSWGYQGTPVAGSSWQTLVSGPGGAIVGTYVRTDGTEAIVNTVDTNEWSLHGHALFQGLLEWVTRGVHLGISRNYLGIDVDDVFLTDDRWNMSGHSTPDDGSSVIRMVPADVTRVLAWQDAQGIRLNMLYNGVGASDGDPLTQALLPHKDAFRWTSHTFAHPNLDASALGQITDELQRNIDFAAASGIAIDPTELVTGQHSGLANPSMPQALASVGVKWIGADASRQPDQYAVGGALTVPRHPTGIYYNVGTRDEQLDEYNWINFTACPANNLGCLKSPADWNTYVSNEATMILRHILDNDPRPHYVHQSNLAEDGTMYPVIDEVLKRYHALFKPSLVQPSLHESGAALQRMAVWRAAVAAGAASGTITSGGQIVVHTDTPVPVPVTGGSVGESYGGVTSGWVTPAAGDATVGGIPGSTPPPPDPAPTPAPTPDPSPAPDPNTQPPPADVPPPDGSYGSVVRGDKAFGFWRLDRDGGDIADGIGGHTGSWRNGPPALVDGIDGRAAGFDGGPAYGELNGIAAPANAYSLEAWVLPTTGEDMAIVEHGAAGALAILGGHVTFRHVRTDVSTTWSVTPGHWYHVVGTWDGAKARLYVDGNLSASTASTERPSGSATLYLGRGSIAPGLNGRLDDVAYYDIALTRTQIAQHTSSSHAFETNFEPDGEPAPAAASSDQANSDSGAGATAGAQTETTSASRSTTTPAVVTATAKPAAKAKKAKAKKKAKARAKARAARVRHAATRRA